MSDIIFLSNVRIAFPNLVEPQVRDNSVSYNADLLMPQDHDGFKQFYTKYVEMIRAKFPEHAEQVIQMLANDRKLRCFGNGNEKVNKKTFKPYDGYQDQFYISAGNKNAPQIIQADGKPVDPNNTLARQTIARQIYGGCRVNAAVKPWIQNNAHGRAIRCELVAVQFAGDDVAFGNATPDVSNMFGAVAGAPAAPAGFGAVAPAGFGAVAPAAPVPPFMA